MFWSKKVEISAVGQPLCCFRHTVGTQRRGLFHSPLHPPALVVPAPANLFEAADHHPPVRPECEQLRFIEVGDRGRNSSAELR